MKIITLTLNTAFDIHCDADQFLPYSENFVNITSKDAGGKGINISRALCAFGRNNIAVAVLGNENALEFERLLVKDKLSLFPIIRSGRIRENVTIHHNDGQETRISFGGITVDKAILDDIHNAVGNIEKDDIIIFAGSIPNGITASDVLKLLGKLKSFGARIVVDSRSLSIDDLASIKPLLIKPNKQEAEKYIQKKIKNIDDAFNAAIELRRCGIENVMLSLGADGAVLATPNGNFYAEPPRINAKSTIGAGDSSIAGFIDAVVDGKSSEECLVRAVAFGTAACMTDGTAPPIPDDVKNIEGQVVVRKK